MRKTIGHGLAGLGVIAATLAASATASAFCGFYVSGADAKLFNDATQVVLMREGTRTVLSMQNSYKGPPQSFAMVVPVPVVLQKENVKTLPMNIFARVDQMTAPRLVEYWEQDPCAPAFDDMERRKGAPRPMKAAAPGGAARGADLGVTVEAQFTVGEYEIVILSAQDAAGLDTWLKREKYKIPDGAEPYLRPYVQAGSKFFVAKVDVTKVKFENGVAALSPLRFHYDAETFSLPVRLGLMNSQGTQDLIVNVFAKGQRYEVANYPNVAIPTNFDVQESARGQFGAFYASLFDRTLEKVPKAVVTEYSWDAGTCDPCPSPPLNPSELSTLGADVLPSAQASGDGPIGGGPAPPMRRRPGWFPSGFVVTRLHARYSKDALGEDLVFRAAPPIIGGREVRSGPNGALEHGATPSSTNNFQGRYAIRHPWAGPIACKNPQRGNWGGPPNGGMPQASPATNLAFAPRGKVQLATFVRGTLPEVAALPGTPTPLGSPVVPVGPSPAPAGGTAAPVASGPALAASEAAAPSSSAPVGPTMPATPPQPHSCGCDVVGGDRAIAPAGLLAGLGIALSAWRRRRRT
ncbi:MAG: DUF2330 domain-containing protein [Deltaproteobacteria bacterium]|nr:DUF2330 domain-containing protein [Deltaproteobacteria bacterium]